MSRKKLKQLNFSKAPAPGAPEDHKKSSAFGRMAAALPFVDTFVSGHSYRTLQQVMQRRGRSIVGEASTRPGRDVRRECERQGDRRGGDTDWRCRSRC